MCTHTYTHTHTHTHTHTNLAKKLIQVFPCYQKNLSAMWEIWVRSPGGVHGNPLQYSCLENAHGQRSLAGYSPWGHIDLDTAERLSIAKNLNELFGQLNMYIPYLYSFISWWALWGLLPCLGYCK